MSTIGTDLSSRKTAVIIPHYQLEHGILRGAVMSAVTQEDISELEIVVVDDGSPAPARDDLQGLKIPAHVNLKLIEQSNRGPGAARNRALDNVCVETAYVAFLDSDDRWSSDHLCNAQYALGRGYEVYFSNAAGYGETLFTSRVDATQHTCIDVRRQLYSFAGDVGVNLISSLNPIHTSTVVYQWQKFRGLRFPEMFRFGEDVTFWLGFARQGGRMAFSANVECLFDEGIHIARNSNWGTPRFIWRTCQAMRWRKWCHNHLDLTAEEEDENEIEIKRLRKTFCLALLHDLKRFRGFTNPDIPGFFLYDPIVILRLLPFGVKVAFNKIKLRS